MIEAGMDAVTETKTVVTDEEEILKIAKKRLKRAVDADNHNRISAVEDLHFLLGDQWDVSQKQRRANRGRPCLQINVLPKYSKQVCGEMRKNRVQVKVRPVDSEADVHLAKIREGIIYGIEYLSNAETIYDHAAKMLVDCGYGAWRVLTRYTEDNPFLQEIYLERILNPFSVFMDPEAKDLNFADAEWGFIIDHMERDTFIEEYGKDKLPGGELVTTPAVGTQEELWWTEDAVVVAEYFYKEYTTKKMCLLSDGQVLEEKDAQEYIDAATKEYRKVNNLNPDVEINEEMIPSIVNKREVKEAHIKWKKITASDVLDKADWAGSFIPIVLLTGEETNVEGKKYIHGLIRDAKDSQRMLNFWHCLSLDTPIPTLTGWTTMGDVRVGDDLFDENGEVCKVLGLSPVHKKHECFEVKFEDGSIIVTDNGHLWEVERDVTKAKNGSKLWEMQTRKTSELIPKKDYIYVTHPLNLPEVDLLIDPYFLGIWLADGTCRDIKITEGTDNLAIRRNLESLGLDLGYMYEDKRHKGVFTFSVYGVKRNFSELGLVGNKHIPAQYLRSSYSQRLSLLQGLMDGDGSIDTKFLCSFTTVNKELANGFAELLRTLGIKFGMLYRKGRIVKFPTYVFHGKPQYQFSFTSPDIQIFRIKRKLERQQAKKTSQLRRTKRHRVMAITPVSSVAVKCVKVSSESSLFLAGEGMIPTHNTSACETVALAPKAPWQATAKMIEGYEQDYLNANEDNLPVMLYNPDPDAAGERPSRLSVGQPPIAIFTEIGRAEQSIKDTIGLYNADVGDTSNENLRDVSGKAVMARQMPGDTATYIYPDTLARGVAYSGKIINDLIPKIYDSERDARLRNPDGTEAFVPVNTTAGKAKETIQSNPQRFSGMDNTKLEGAIEEQGENAKYNDITVGKYDVVVSTGPSFATQRVEAAENMVKIASAVNMNPVDKYFIVRNMDFPGSDEYATVIKRMIPPGLLPPEPGDPPQQPQGPSMEEQESMAKIELDKGKAETEKLKLQLQALKLQKEIGEDKSNIRKDVIELLAELNAPEHEADQMPIG